MKLARNRIALAGAAALAGLALVSPASALFKCVDENGVTHYGDTMPPQCEKTPVTEISGQGTVKKKYDGVLTPEQIKARDQEAAKKKEDDKREAEQKRIDGALLATYGSEREFDVSRDRAIEQIDARWKTASDRIKDVDKQLAKMNNEMEFYNAGKSSKSQAKDAPTQLKQDLDRIKAERAQVEDSMKKMEEEKAALREKFEKDKERWKVLRTGKISPRP
jgi:chromosome segregation ATPase